MKKQVLLGLALLLAMVLSVPALAAVDLSYVTTGENADLYEVTEEDDLAFINTNVYRNFSIRMELEDDPENRDSYAYSDIIVLDHKTEEEAAYWRLWVEYRAPEVFLIHSMDLTFQGTKYTFQYLDSNSYIEDEEDSVRNSTTCVLMGESNTEFWLKYVLWYLSTDVEEVLNTSLPVTLRGRNREVNATISGGSLIDLGLMGVAMLEIGGEEEINLSGGNPVIAEVLETEEEPVADEDQPAETEPPEENAADIDTDSQETVIIIAPTATEEPPESAIDPETVEKPSEDDTEGAKKPEESEEPAEVEKTPEPASNEETEEPADASLTPEPAAEEIEEPVTEETPEPDATVETAKSAGTKAASEGQKAICIGRQVNVRVSPSERAWAIGMITKGQAVIVLGTEGEWTQISCDAGKGYVKSVYIQLSE